MLVIDSSALIAILLGEPAANDLANRISAEADRDYRMSAPTYVEAGTVLAARRGSLEAAREELDEFVDLIGIRIEPLTASQAKAALTARVRYGRGFETRAKLNFGDAMAYALAKELDAPLLFISDDFTHTDIRAAL